MTSKPGKKWKSKIPRKASARPISTATVPWDQGADGPANRVGLVDQERGELDLNTGKLINPNRVFGKARMPIFMRLMRQKLITPEHASAAQRLYAAYAGYPTKDPLAAIAERVDNNGQADPNVTLLDKRREFYAMWQRVPDKCKPIVEHVVLNENPITGAMGGRRSEAAAHMIGLLTQGLGALQ